MFARLFVPLAAPAFGQVMLSAAHAGSQECVLDDQDEDSVLLQKVWAGTDFARRHWQIQADDIAASILTSGKEPYLSRVELVQKTWASYFEAFEAFTFDANHSEHVRHVEPYGPDEQTTRATGMNLAMIPEMLTLHPSAKWYLQADDDTLIVPHQWRSLTAGLDWHEPVLSGRCSGYPPDSNVAFVIGGAGMVISRGLAEKLAPRVLECRQEFNWYGYGDARIGGCMRKVLGEGYQKAIHCLTSATNNNTELLDKSIASQPILSLHEKNLTRFEYAWSYLEADITAGHNVTVSAVKVLDPSLDDGEPMLLMMSTSLNVE